MNLSEMMNAGRNLAKAYNAPEWATAAFGTFARGEWDMKAAWLGGEGDRYINLIIEGKYEEREKPIEIRVIVLLDDVIEMLPAEVINFLPDAIRIIVAREMEVRHARLSPRA